MFKRSELHFVETINWLLLSIKHLQNYYLGHKDICLVLIVTTDYQPSYTEILSI